MTAPALDVWAVQLKVFGRFVTMGQFSSLQMERLRLKERKAEWGPMDAKAGLSDANFEVIPPPHVAGQS